MTDVLRDAKDIEPDPRQERKRRRRSKATRRRDHARTSATQRRLTLAGRSMAKVYVSTVIDAPAAEVWRSSAISTACRTGRRSPRKAASSRTQRADQVGCIRNFALKDGGRIRERLLALSDYDLS